MKTNLAILLAAGVLALAGCSSTPTKVDTGTIRARTFNFVDASNRPVPKDTENRQAIHAMVQAAITKNLAARGVEKVPAGGDVTVAYLVIVGNNVVTTAVEDYFGYGRDANALLDKAHSSSKRTGNPNAFEAGTLVIDIISAKDFKLLKRAYATRSILRNLPTDERAARIQEVVDVVLRDARFSP
jgi:ABC-type Fe3+-hydroxamate transport system substrate-binding protein